jgi:methionyl-tRNA formyltransferase
MMRVVLYGSGSPVSIAALRALAPVAEIAAVVVPAGRRICGPRSALRALSGRRARRELVSSARRLRMPVLRARPGIDPDLEAALARLRPDLICVATFPHLLRATTLAIPRHGTVGLHPSLLPRHRGPDPLFWTYHDGDAEAGVTVFWMTAGEDDGDIVFQEAIPLARGRPGPDLYAEVARRGAALLARTVVAVEAGNAPRMAQESDRATREPAPGRGAVAIDFAAWGTERVWHFLRGVAARGGLVADVHGTVIPHRAVRGHRLEAISGTPGKIRRSAQGWQLLCRDGVVELEPAGALRRALWRARRLAGLVRPPAAPNRRTGAAAERTGTRSSA